MRRSLFIHLINQWLRRPRSATVSQGLFHTTQRYSLTTMEEVTPLLSDPTTHGTMTPSTTSEAIQNESTSLSKLSSTVYFFKPTGKPTDDSPSAIIIFGWMGAPLRHMAKFVDYYSQTMFPGSPIILVLSPTNRFLAKEHERRKAMEPAYTAYQSLNIQRPNNVLVHIFSGGGVNAFRTFVSLTPSKSFSPRQLVLDSAPGVASLRTFMIAFTADIKSRLKRFYVSIFLVIVYTWMRFRDWVVGKEPILDDLRNWLVDGNAIDKSTKRVFLYSDNDQLVQKESVESHIHDLEEKGYPVRSRNFGNTRHVGHMRADPEEYWKAILGVWRE